MIVLCIVAILVIGVVVYIATKRYYEHMRQKTRFKRLEKLAMFIPATSTKIDRLKKRVKGSARRSRLPVRTSEEGSRRRSSSLDHTIIMVHEPHTDEQIRRMEEEIGLSRRTSSF